MLRPYPSARGAAPARAQLRVDERLMQPSLGKGSPAVDASSCQPLALSVLAHCQIKSQIVHESTPVDCRQCRVDSSQDRVEAVDGSASSPLFVFALRTAHTPAARCVYPSRLHPSPCRSTLESFGLHAFRGAPQARLLSRFSRKGQRSLSRFRSVHASHGPLFKEDCSIPKVLFSGSCRPD